jgi:acyl-coenzyme A thioesterase PaaI-like protein
MGGQRVPAAIGTAADGEIEALRRGLGRDGIPVPAYQTLGIEMRSVEAGGAVVRVPVSPYLTAPDGGLLPGTFAVLADACCGAAIVSAMAGGGATLTAQLPAGHSWIEGRAEADAVDDETGLARAEIVDEGDQLLGVASLRIMRTSIQKVQPGTATPAAPGRFGAPENPAERAAERPVNGLVGVASRFADSGQSAWRFRPPRAAANSYGMLHGGVLGLIAYEVASDAIGSAIGPGEELLPLDLVLNFYRGVPVSAGHAAATARVTHRGRRFVVAEGEVIGPDGRRALRLSVGTQIRTVPG